MQKRAARLILNKDYNTRSHELFTELGWMPLEDRITFNRAVQVYKCLNDTNTQGLDGLFDYNKNIHMQNTRAAAENKLYIAWGHPKSFSRLGAKIWNNIPAPVREAKSNASFKNMYRKQYFEDNS